jgi:methyl-accepting chemotaxis protein
VTGRSSEHLGWSVCIIYSEEEIFGECNSLSFYIWVIVIISLILSFLITGFVIHSQLKPLLMLTKQAQYIAKGHLDEEIPDSRRVDEIGRLQRNFKLMQQSLATNIGELEQLTTELKQHGEELSKAYKQAQKADRIKTAFLHNMTNQMLEPSESICQDVETLCNPDKKGEQKDTSKLANDIQQNGTTIAELLKNLINMSDEDMRKEVQDA